MFSKIVVLSFIFQIYSKVHALVELSSVEDNTIVTTEAVIRNTTNKLFSCLKLVKPDDKRRLEQYSIIHKYFISLTLQDARSLREIFRITRVRSENNPITNFMATINEILNTDYKNELNHGNVIDDNVDKVVEHIKYYLNELKQANDELKNNKAYENINNEVLKRLRNLDTEIFKENLDGYESENSIENNTLTEDAFWQPSGRRIYEGERTKIKHYPFLASIHIFQSFQCAGSIIKSDLIITASSCLQLAWNNRLFRENPAFLSTRIGSSYYNGRGEVVPILEVYFHPGYNPKTLKHNVCILRLRRKINFRSNKRVRKIGFDRNPSPIPYNTGRVTVLGWGAKGKSGIVELTQNMLSFARLDVYPLKECQEVYSKEYVTHNNFCAGFFSKGGGACNHDVGGPGISDGKLMGVISFGSPVCGTPDAPTVFTKLGYYAKWIEDIMEMPVPDSKKRTTPKTERPLMMKTHKSRPTTFKIPPLDGPIKPKPIHELDTALRMFDNDLFRDFLKTLFDSQEVDAYLLKGKDEYNVKGTKEVMGEKNYEDILKLTTANPLIAYGKEATYADIDEFAEHVTQISDVNIEVESSPEKDTTIEETFFQDIPQEEEKIQEPKEKEMFDKKVEVVQRTTKIPKKSQTKKKHQVKDVQNIEEKIVNLLDNAELAKLVTKAAEVKNVPKFVDYDDFIKFEKEETAPTIEKIFTSVYKYYDDIIKKDTTAPNSIFNAPVPENLDTEELAKLVKNEIKSAEIENDIKQIEYLSAEENTKEEELLTLLMSDEDEEKGSLELNSVIGEGLSIPSETFVDATRSRGNILKTFPKEELYKILIEVIDSEIKNKTAGI